MIFEGPRGVLGFLGGVLGRLGMVLGVTWAGLGGAWAGLGDLEGVLGPFEKGSTSRSFFRETALPHLGRLWGITRGLRSPLMT